MAGRHRFVLVVTQYNDASLHKEKMIKAMKDLEGPNSAGKSQYNMRLASEEDSFRLSGFAHNAVTPLGMKTRLPILMSKKIADLVAQDFWLGGGHTDLKLNISKEEFVRSFGVLVAELTQ